MRIPDGTAEIHAHYTVQLDDGTLVYSAYDPSNCRPMPPIMAATRCPALSSPRESSTTVPTHSIPSTRGSFTLGE